MRIPDLRLPRAGESHTVRGRVQQDIADDHVLGSLISSNFWSVIHELDLEHQKKFLFFATGSDRAPVGGLGSIRFAIHKNGEDNEQLPSSHTCFNVLILPPYRARDKLKAKLLIAINNSEGFGLS